MESTSAASSDWILVDEESTSAANSGWRRLHQDEQFRYNFPESPIAQEAPWGYIQKFNISGEVQDWFHPHTGTASTFPWNMEIREALSNEFAELMRCEKLGEMSYGYILRPEQRAQDVLQQFLMQISSEAAHEQ